MIMRRILAGLLLLLAFSVPVWAEIPLDGTLVAQRACPALQSIRRQTNPGNVTLHPGTSYHIVAANAADATHYWVIVPGAQPERRWVAVECGTRNGSQPSQPIVPAGQRPTAKAHPQYILAVSWQPTFCEAHANKRECRNQTQDRFDATHFTLHGLWPQPRQNVFCGVDARQMRNSEHGQWDELPRVTLSARLRTALDRVMPGTRSQLERHEWTKHGTCYGTNQEEYFADALAMMEALNRSAIVDLFAANIGRQVSQRQIRAAFDQAFGPGAGQRVRISCIRDGSRSLISGLTIGLSGTITSADDFGALVGAAHPTDGGCTIGTIDRTGLQ